MKEKYSRRKKVRSVAEGIKDIYVRVKKYLEDEETKIRSTYIENSIFSLYIRKSGKVKFAKTFDIARISITNDKYQQKGYGTMLIEILHNIPNNFEYTYIESIHHEGLIRWCENNGWTITGDEDTPSFYKRRQLISK